MFRLLNLATVATLSMGFTMQGKARLSTAINENFNFLPGEDMAANTDPAILGEVNYKNFVTKKSGIDNPLVVRQYPLVERVKELQLLSKTAESGLLSQLEAQGLTLSKLEKILPLAEELGLLDLLSSNPEFLLNNVAPLAVEPAPVLLPILAKVVSVPPTVFRAASLAIVGAEGFIITQSDSVILDILTAIPLLGVGGLLFAVSNVLSTINEA